MDGICPVVGGASVVESLWGYYIRAYHVAFRRVWQGATQTDGFGVYPGTWTLIAGTLVSVGLSRGASSMGDYTGITRKAIRFIRLDLLCGRKRLGMIVSGMMTVAMIGVNVWVFTFSASFHGYRCRMDRDGGIMG